MSQLIIDVNKIKGIVLQQPPTRYRVMGQLSEINNHYISDGYICELGICNLPEFGNACNSEETLRVIVGEKVYESRFVSKCSNNSNTRQHHQRQPQEGDAVSVYLGIVHLSGMRKMFEVMDITVLTLTEVRSLRTFVKSSLGTEFLQLSSPQ